MHIFFSSLIRSYFCHCIAYCLLCLHTALQSTSTYECVRFSCFFCALRSTFFLFSPSLSRYGYSILFVLLRLCSTRSCYMPTLCGGVYYKYVKCKLQGTSAKKRKKTSPPKFICIYVYMYAPRYQVRRARMSIRFHIFMLGTMCCCMPTLWGGCTINNWITAKKQKKQH